MEAEIRLPQTLTIRDGYAPSEATLWRLIKLAKLQCSSWGDLRDDQSVEQTH